MAARWAIGDAIAAHLNMAARRRERIAIDATPRLRTKRVCGGISIAGRWTLPCRLLLVTAPLRLSAEQVYFHRRARIDAHDVLARAICLFAVIPA